MRCTKNYEHEINVLMQSLFKQSEAWQNLYDKETSNGSNREAQLQWNDTIAARLTQLNAYKAKRISKSF